MNDKGLASLLIIIGYTITVLIVLIKEMRKAKKNGTSPKKITIVLFVLWMVICGGYAVYRFLNL